MVQRHETTWSVLETTSHWIILELKIGADEAGKVGQGKSLTLHEIQKQRIE